MWCCLERGGPIELIRKRADRIRNRILRLARILQVEHLRRCDPKQVERPAAARPTRTELSEVRYVKPNTVRAAGCRQVAPRRADSSACHGSVPTRPKICVTADRD